MGLKHAAEAQRHYGALAAFEPRKLEAQSEASEMGKLLIRKSLGSGEAQPVGGGTELPSETEGAPSLFGEKQFGTKELGIAPAWGGTIGAKVLDPEKYAAAIKGSAEYRIADRLTRRAEALVSQSGPEWDQLVRLTQLPIIESSAMASRENAQAISEAMRGGGAGVRTAYATIQKMREKERQNFQRTQAVASNMRELISHGEQFAQSQLGFNEAWTKSLPFQDSWNEMNRQISELFLETSLPFMAKQNAKANAIRNQMRVEKKKKLTGILTATAGVVMMVATKGAMGSSLVGSGISQTLGASSGRAALFGQQMGEDYGVNLGPPQEGGQSPLTDIFGGAKSLGGTLLSPLWNKVQQKTGTGPYALPGPLTRPNEGEQWL